MKQLNLASSSKIIAHFFKVAGATRLSFNGYWQFNLLQNINAGKDFNDVMNP